VAHAQEKERPGQVKPIRQTIELANELSRYQPDVDVLEYLQDMADKVQAVVPDCVGLSVAWLDRGVAFTLVATDEEIAVLDAVQYLAGGPCVDAVADDQNEGIEAREGDLLDEGSWQYFSQATAAQAIRSTLTLPLTQDGAVVGSANLYAASDRAFEGHDDEIAMILGASASGIVRNADLSFSTRQAAERSPESAKANGLVDVAVGMIAESLKLDPDTAAQRLMAAAQRAGISLEKFARALVHLRRF
jgi:GAF domain-containing protein